MTIGRTRGGCHCARCTEISIGQLQAVLRMIPPELRDRFYEIARGLVESQEARAAAAPEEMGQ
jgi:hypothetical protein